MKLSRLIISLFALLLLLPIQATAENLEFEPTSWDYGEVQIGDGETMTFTVKSIGPNPLLVDDISMRNDATGSFEIDSIMLNGEEILDPYFEVVVDDQFYVEVIFTPQVEGMLTADLNVSSDAANYPQLNIPLQGEGIPAQTPDEMMLEVIDFYDEAIAEGWLSGRARGQSGATTATMFREMLVDVYELIVAGNDNKACRELSKVLVRIDGASSPPDLVDGSVRGAVYNMLVEVGVALECF